MFRTYITTFGVQHGKTVMQIKEIKIGRDVIQREIAFQIRYKTNNRFDFVTQHPA
jgi:hypothetical protein